MCQKINRFQWFTAIFFLKKEIRISFLIRITIVAFNCGLIILLSSFPLALYNSIYRIPAIMNSYLEIVVLFNYFSLILIVVLKLKDLLYGKKYFSRTNR